MKFLRPLAHTPGFTAVAVLTLGSSLAVLLVVLAFYQATVLTPLRVPAADRIVQLWSAHRDGSVSRPAVSWPLFERVRTAEAVFASAAAALPTGFTIQDGVAPRSVGGVRITASLTAVLGVRPVAGRTFSAAEDAAGGPAVVMLAETFWKSHYDGRATVIGESLALDGVAHEIVGVLPAELSQLFAGDAVYVPRPFEIPNAPREVVARGGVPYQVFARLRPGIEPAAADLALRTLVENYRSDAPQNNDVNRDLAARRLTDQLATASRPVVTALLGIAACSLAIAIGSLANLFLLRLVSRARSFAVRASLGGTRAQIASGPLAEAALITIGGLVTGLAFASLALPVVNHVTAPYLPRLPDAEFSAGLGFVAVVIAALVAAGLVALTLGYLRGVPMSDALRARSATNRGTARTHRILVAGQIAATLALVAGALVLGTNLRQLSDVAPGFAPDGLATAFVNLPRPRYPAGEDRLAFYRAALERLRHAPGITDATVVSIAPLARTLPPGPVTVAGRPVDATNQPTAIVRVIGDDYFATLRTPLREGRVPLERDARPVAAISAGLARRLFPDQSAVGQTLLLGPAPGTATEIVGVVADLRAHGLTQDATDEIYVPLTAGNAGPQMAFVVRTDGAPETIQPALRAAVAGLDAQQSVAVFQTYPSLIAASIWPQRIAAGVAMTFAVSSTAFALVGLFGLVSLWVSQRTNEWGLRAALGATPLTIVRHVLRSAGMVVLAGAVAGLALATAGNQALRTLLVGIDPTDPLLLTTAALSFLAVALVACALPAIRAARVDPATALRSE
jgi:putative ABC transport system permease protein